MNAAPPADPTAAAERPGGVRLLPGLLPAADCAAWTTLADTLLAEAQRQAADGTVAAGFHPHSSSLQLSLQAPAALDRLLVSLQAGPLAAVCRAALGPRAWVNLDACWLRRQYPAGQAPAGHHPHHWHQDGALGVAFPDDHHTPPPPEALLQLCTCWIALTPCGRDAPGLEWRAGAAGPCVGVAGAAGPPAEAGNPHQLLALAQLSGPGLQRLLDTLPGHAPELGTGDALCFDGALLHRTQQHPGQTRVRTSLELRFFGPCAALDRLAGQRLRRWG